MKKILAIILSLICICSFTQLYASAENGSVKVSSVSTNAGGSVTVNITLSSNPGIVAMLLYVEYDSTVLTLTGAKNGKVFANEDGLFSDDLSTNPYTMLWTKADDKVNSTVTDVLATLTFKVKPGAQNGTYPINVILDDESTFDCNIQDVPFTVQNGSVTVGTKPADSAVEMPKTYKMTYKDKAQFKSPLKNEYGDTLPVSWKSDNPKVVSVDQNGNITTHKKGNAVIHAVNEAEGLEATCTVTVKYSFAQSLIIYVLFGFIWYVK